jgi:hypothetical protein
MWFSGNWLILETCGDNSSRDCLPAVVDNSFPGEEVVLPIEDNETSCNQHISIRSFLKSISVNFCQFSQEISGFQTDNILLV